MPMYYFDCHHADCPEDCLGHDLADAEAAHKMGVEFAGKLIQHEAQALVDGHDLKLPYQMRTISCSSPSMRCPWQRHP